MRCPSTLLAHALALIALPAVAGPPDWSPATVLVQRNPLEIANPLPGTGDASFLHVPVLFDSVPELQLVHVDLRPVEPSATATTIVADGSVFALGPADEIANGTLGGAFIDGFQLRFWHANPPYGIVENTLIDGGSTWIDSGSGAAGDSFFVSAVRFDGGEIRIFQSPDGGVTWLPVRTVNPTPPLYFNFDGGERVSLWVDPDATTPATTRNCVFYETISGGTTTKRVSCADGAAPVFDVPLATDVPSPGMVFDNYIENAFVPDLSGGAFGVLTIRTDQEGEVVSFEPDGTFTRYPAGSAPAAPAVYSVGAAPGAGNRVDVATPSAPSAPLVHTVWDRTSGQTGGSTGPSVRQGPLKLWRYHPGAVLYAIFALDYDSDGVTPSLGIAQFPAPGFADGFESGDTSAWSNTVP